MIKNKYDFIYLYDVEYGNPNGDPDMGNLPRTDAETNTGIVSNGSLKRKVRDYISLLKDDENDVPEKGFEVFCKNGAVLNTTQRRAYTANNLVPKKRTLPKSEVDQKLIAKFLNENFIDIRSFGAVMTTDVNCGKPTGTVQIHSGVSIDPVYPQQMAITRVCVTTEAEKAASRNGGHTMGSKQFIPYGLYRSYGHISASLSKKSGFSEDDLSLLWESLMNMFDQFNTASSGERTARKLIIFKHDTRMGNSPANKLFDLVNIKKKEGIEFPRSFKDYIVEIDDSKVPKGVNLIVKD